MILADGLARLRRGGMARGLAGFGLAALIGFAAFAGAFRSAENGLQNLGFALRERPASGQLHIVEMDAASVAAAERWPLPREHYARLVQRLDAAGVRTIALDVDFSTPSTPEQDALFAAALADASATIVLPIFGQAWSFGDRRQLDSLPIPELKRHALLGSVSVAPGADGIVREMPLGTVNEGAPRPSLSAQIAQQAGAAGATFPIDFAIDPATIPRHSLVAIERGAFDEADLRGRDVIVGATAIEMGDRYAVPVRGVLPGVVVQAIAAETLYAGLPLLVGWPLPLIAGAILSIGILASPTRGAVLARTLVAAASLLAGWHLLGAVAGYRIELTPGLTVLVVSALARVVVLVRREIEATRLTDPESGMPNRRALEKRVGAGSNGHAVVAMIEGFDALKSVVGQESIGGLLSRIEDRLSVAGCEAPIYRVDDRALAWVSTREPYEIEGMLAGLGAIMRSPIEIDGRRVDVALTFGIAEDRRLSEAVHAASLAHASGKAWRYHETAQKAALEQQVSLMGELDTALENGELQVLYQPKLDLAADRIASAEALVRWHHPTRGDLRPDTFIPLAEETNRIDALTLFVLRRAIEDLRNWAARGRSLGAAVNISARLISSPEFIAEVDRILRAADVPRDRLIFEITESATLRDPEAARAVLERFRSLGVAISMDDYGTGQSTLSYLKNLPLSELKIDRSFVRFAHRDRSDAMLVRSTVELAHQLGLKVVAEGIEETECLAFLRSIGCDYAQGYLVGRPMSAEDLFELAADRPALAA